MDQNERKYMKHNWSKAVDGEMQDVESPELEEAGVDSSQGQPEEGANTVPETEQGEGAETSPMAQYEGAETSPMTQYEDAEAQMALDSERTAEQQQQPTVGKAKTTISVKGKTSQEMEDRLIEKSKDKIAREIAQ